MFGPCDRAPELKKAVTFRLVFESGKPFVVISHGRPDDWVKYQVNDDQVWGFVRDAFPRLRGR
jgi:hypothetical protein